MLHRGKLVVKEIKIGDIRELVRDDLELLKEKRTMPVVAKLRDTHHAVARLVALGLRPIEIGERTGYSLSRIHSLSLDPAFKNLVEDYRKEVDGTYEENLDRYKDLLGFNAIAAERMIKERLLDACEQGETLPIRELHMVSRDAADRLGYGKRQTNVNVNVDFAAQLEKAIQRSGKVIEHVAVRPHLQAATGATQPAAPALPQPIVRRA